MFFCKHKTAFEIRISDWSSDVCPSYLTHPGHAIASRQQSGFGAMLSFELAGGVEEVRRFIANVRYFTLAESLGGVESLVAHPATMTHADMGEDARTIAGISDRLLRLSIGQIGRAHV